MAYVEKTDAVQPRIKNKGLLDVEKPACCTSNEVPLPVLGEVLTENALICPTADSPKDDMADEKGTRPAVHGSDEIATTKMRVEEPALADERFEKEEHGCARKYPTTGAQFEG